MKDINCQSTLERNNPELPMSITHTQFVAENLRTKKIPGPDGFTGEFHKTFKEEIVSTVQKLQGKIEEEEIFPNSFNEAGP